MATDFDSEPLLIAALIEKREDAFRHVIKKHQSAMLQLAYSIVGNKLADEVVQEAWVSAMRALPKFQQRSSLKTWLMTIVSNEAKSRLRKENRNVSLDTMSGEDPMAERFDHRGHWAESGVVEWDDDSPDALMESDALAHCMQALIETLPEMQAATLNLREQQGYSLAEICNILEVSESNVRVLLHRARNRLFKCIEHFQQTGECCTN